MPPTLSVVIPTRERALYLGHAIRTCLQSKRQDFEVLVLDNASADDTSEVVAAIPDSRIRYERNEFRLSMRDNFEKGIDSSKGEIICFIGDDDGLLPNAIDQSLDIFQRYAVDALSAARAAYCWPDLLTSRKNTALLPRGKGISIVNSRSALFHLLNDCDYYKLPCLYHGFVRRSLVDRVRKSQTRFFLSSQVDMFSSIALSMENIPYAFSRSPLVVNGASKRSNGAAHFGGGGTQEKTLWKKEDDLGFLPGFDQSLSVGSLIIESALRYSQAHQISICAMLDVKTVEEAAEYELALRSQVNRPVDEIRQFRKSLEGVLSTSSTRKPLSFHRTRRINRLFKTFLNARPIDFQSKHITNVYDGALYLDRIMMANLTGFLHSPLEQITTAFRMAKS
jgi:glycosyltransferase involved in cell wall biosynthesis